MSDWLYGGRMEYATSGARRREDYAESLRALAYSHERKRAASVAARVKERERCDKELRGANAEAAAARERERAEYRSRAATRRPLDGRSARALDAIVRDPESLAWFERVALHEAAHAVAHWVAGAGVDAVGITLPDQPGGPVGGYCRALNMDFRSPLACLAGIAAERIAGLAPVPGSHDGDYRHARELLRAEGRSGAPLETEIGYAEDTLRRVWPTVLTLAQSLRLEIDLDGPRAERIIEESRALAQRLDRAA